MLFEKYDGSYLLLEMGQVSWFNACGISFHTDDGDSAENHLDFVQVRLVNDETEIKDLLVRQVSNGVRFRESILLMKEMGVDTFVEIGPQKTITGFVKKIDRELKTINIDKLEDLEQLKDL